MKFNSKNHTIFKYNLVNCLLERALKICSSESNIRSYLEKSQKSFYQNAFPVYFTDKGVNQKLSSLRNISQATFDFPKKIMFVSLSSIWDLSNKNIRLELTKSISSLLSPNSVSVCFQKYLFYSKFFPFQRPCSLWPAKLCSL